MADEEYVEAVLSLVEQIPKGRVMSYGSIAEYVGQGGPRQVGSVMSHYGGAVPWHRVVAANGRLVPGHEVEALKRHRKERTPLKGDRVDMSKAEWHPES